MLLAVEAAAGRRKCVVAEEGVMQTLQLHRLAELRSTGGLVGACVWRHERVDTTRRGLV